MKPFDLEAAKRGEPIQTRDGKKARFVAHVPELHAWRQLVAVVDDELWHYHYLGIFSEYGESLHDLFMTPKKRTVWVNFYSSGVAAYDESEQDANDNAGSARIGGKAYPVEIDDE